MKGRRRRGRCIRLAMCALAALSVWMISAEAAVAAPPQITNSGAAKVTSSSATLTADINPQGKPTRFHFEYGTADCTSNPCTSIPIPEGEIPAGSSPVHVEVTVEGLTPAAIYHFRTLAKNGEQAKGPDRIFTTRGSPSEGLPDNRAYEQSSPVDKDGGDATGKVALVKAADNGSGITFNSTFGIPGGKGAQALPTYLALRGGGGSGWATQGLLSPPLFGERAQVQGWLPDFSETFSNATKLGSPRIKALVSQSTTGGSATVVASYTAKAEYSYVGASADASIVFFESQAKLPPAEGEDPIEAAIDGASNLYAWDRVSGRLSLAGILNDGKAPPKGAFAGPYHRAAGASAQTLREGGAGRGYYLQGTHTITLAGNIYFTEAVSGQLYLRLNPTQPQSDLLAGKCAKPAEACTIHVSASKRSTPDPAGAQPAAFQAASVDGSAAFFTSSEKLTNDANTGPEQPAPAIGIGNSTTGAIEKADFIPKRAVGVALDSTHVYWADPVGGTIGRADLNGENPDDGFIVPGPSECEEEETEPGVFVPVPVPSKPRYVAVDAGHIYWTNTGKLEGNGDPAEAGGTIGRADVGGTNSDPDFICGASNPQGIAVNATHVYWANAAKDPVKRSIARAAIGGGEIEQEFFPVNTSRTPYGVALSPTHVYFSINNETSDFGSVRRIPLAGGEEKFFNPGKAGIRGVATDATHVYWATQGEEAIGRADLELTSGENEFVKPAGKLNGLATDASHLYWSVNGESPSNPGNDLYRYQADTDTLTDLTPDSVDTNGAEVQGVLGASEDGSHVYFAANGDLDGGGPASAGDCHTQGAHGPLATTSGSCSVYLWHDGAISLVAQLRGKANSEATDALAWTGTPRELFSTAGFVPKTSFLSQDGQTLLFRSQEKLTEYDNEGVPELYRYSAETQTVACVSCPPSGEAVGKGPSLGSVSYPGPIAPALASVAMVQSRNLSADGNRAFFETAEALVPEDTNGEVSCPALGAKLTPACLDTYEWEAPGTGTCKEAGPGYSVLNEGCIYLISTGTSEFPSYFADASQSGDDVFFFTRQQLVDQDKDELQDVYDARVGGGLASQNPITLVPCESAEACHGPGQEAPAESSPGSATFIGPGNPVGKHKKPKAAKHKAKGHKHQRRSATNREVNR
jgi:hypothetical protein